MQMKQNRCRLITLIHSEKQSAPAVAARSRPGFQKSRAKAHRESHTFTAKDYDEFKDTIENKPGFIKAMWCGDRACEDKIKEVNERDVMNTDFSKIVLSELDFY